MYPGIFAAKHPDKIAALMADTGDQITFAELESSSTRLARLLRQRGFVRGDHIALISENNLRCFEVYWAALRSGLYITCVNRHLTPDEMAYIVNDCGAQALIASSECATLAEAVAGQCGALTTKLSFGGAIDGFKSYEAALSSVSDEPLGDQPCGTDMLYSSGTTGRPKGIKPPLPDRQIDDPGDLLRTVFGKIYGFDEDTVFFTPSPLYHAAPLRFGSIVQSLGGTVIATRRFDALASLEAIERFKVTHSQWVPTMFVRMLKLPEEERNRHDLSSMKVAIHSAAPCPVTVKQAMLDWWGPIVYEFYGSTEGNGGTFISPEEWICKPGSVGRAGVGVIHICDEDGKELPTHERGTVYFERDELPFRYHNDEEKTRAAIHPHHPTWTTTGDIGYLDEDGFLFLTDRKAFVIISGGVNIYPQEIENCLTLHEAVDDVAVIGVPDDEMGESVKAVVKLAPGYAASAELEGRLIEYVKERVARYKAPRSVDFVEMLPRTPTGKLAKTELKQRYREASTGSRAVA
jgi:Acyl-CoA synthetases (AMP-forming)/AMP-acid ligases II